MNCKITCAVRFSKLRFTGIIFHHGINIFYGDNAQGKTNILEGIYLCMTNKSYRGSHDKEMIRFGKEEAHLRLEAEKKRHSIPVDMHLKKSKTKGIAINGVPIRRSSEFDWPFKCRFLFTRGSSGDKKRSWRAQTLFGHGALPA